MQMKFVAQSGLEASRIGQGTWYLGENSRTFGTEVEALRAGIDAGLR